MRIHRDTRLPEILVKYPSCRKVLDLYGLAGCGGPHGPNESLSFFARAHQVDEETLLRQLQTAVNEDHSDPSELEYRPGLADAIYRPFFKAGIVVMFTAGCVLGGVNLGILASRGELAALDLRATIWAHAHAQIAGWVTLFVMGFAYQAFPRFKSTRLWEPRLAWMTFYTMAASLTVRTIAGLFDQDPVWQVVGTAAGLLELLAVIGFVVVLAKTFQRSIQPTQPYEKFVFASLFWMVLAFLTDLAVFMASGRIQGEREWIQFIGLYDAPWRDIQLLGFAGTMILGVSQRFLPFIYGTRQVPARTALFVLLLWNVSLATHIAAYMALFQFRTPAAALLWELSIVGMLASVAILIRGFRLFARNEEADESLRFIRAGYVWALVSLGWLMLLPVYSRAVGMAFSHAFFGAYRHAFTVGFISMMIVGVSSKVVPILAGIDRSRLGPLWVAFWFINIGSAMRVGFQTLSDLYGWAFPLMALSAWVEVTGFGIWAFHLWRIMNAQPDKKSIGGPVEITADAKVYDVVTQHPQTEEVFLAFGFDLIRNPAARQVFARSVSLAQACRLKGVPEDEFLGALRRRVSGRVQSMERPLVTIQTL